MVVEFLILLLQSCWAQEDGAENGEETFIYSMQLTVRDMQSWTS